MKRSEAPVYRLTWVMAYIVQQRKTPYPVQMVYMCVAHLNCYQIHCVMWKYLKPINGNTSSALLSRYIHNGLICAHLKLVKRALGLHAYSVDQLRCSAQPDMLSPVYFLHVNCNWWAKTIGDSTPDLLAYTHTQAQSQQIGPFPSTVSYPKNPRTEIPR